MFPALLTPLGCTAVWPSYEPITHYSATMQASLAVNSMLTRASKCITLAHHALTGMSSAAAACRAAWDR